MLRNLTLAVLLFALSGCATTKLVDHWQSEEFSRGDLDNLLIIAVTNNVTNRFLFETEMERRMLQHGVQGSTSLKEIGDEFPNKDVLEAFLKENNQFDFIMATRLSNVEETSEYIPPQVRTYYTGPYYPTWGHYYGGYYGSTITMTKEGYTDTRQTVVLVTTIFDINTREPVWVGRSETFEPGSVAVLADEIALSTWREIKH